MPNFQSIPKGAGRLRLYKPNRSRLKRLRMKHLVCRALQNQNRQDREVKKTCQAPRAKFKKCAWYLSRFNAAWNQGMFAVDYLESRYSKQDISKLCADGTLFTEANDAIAKDTKYLHSQGFSDENILKMETAGVNAAQARLAYNGRDKDEFIEDVLNPKEDDYVIGQVGAESNNANGWRTAGKIAASAILALGAGTVAAGEYPFTELTEYHYTNTWMSGSDTNRLIFYSVRDPPSGGMRKFHISVKNQTDETFNEARHYGTGWVGAGAEGWDYEITDTNFLRFYNGHLGGGAQQVFIDGSSLTQANQVAIVPFEMDNNEGGSRTGYVLGPQVPEPEALALLLIGAGLLGAKRED